MSLELTLPESVPVGAADVTITISPKENTHHEARGKDGLKETPYEELRAFAGAFANSGTFNRDGVTIQREMRDEWEWGYMTFDRLSEQGELPQCRTSQNQ